MLTTSRASQRGHGKAITRRYNEIQNSRVLRGGSFLYQASDVRSAYRDNDVPTYRNSNSVSVRRGLLPLDCFTALPLPRRRSKMKIDLIHMYTIQ